MSRLAPGTELRHGQRHYRIEATIGAGGQGEVYRARDLRNDTVVALKLPLHLGERATAQAAREIRLLRALAHPVFPRLLDDFPLPGGEHILVMTFVAGEDLGVQLRARRAPFPAEQVLRWADSLLDGLAAIHQQNIIHRDIKPDNLKAEGDAILLLDLGLAKELDTTTTVTIPGLTPAYAPIEQLDLDDLDPRSDLYALAATLYHLLTGTLPPSARKRRRMSRAAWPTHCSQRICATHLCRCPSAACCTPRSRSTAQTARPMRRRCANSYAMPRTRPASSLARCRSPFSQRKQRPGAAGTPQRCWR